MTRRMTTTAVITVTLFYLMSGSLAAQDYAKALADAVDRHRNGAPDANLELGLVDELAGLSEKSASAWLPDFWAAYFLTQVTMRHSEERQERLRRAQVHLDRARERATASDPSARTADLHALQSLVHEFVLGGIKEKEEKERLEALAAAELEAAFELDPQSPVVMVHAGTDLIRAGQKEESWGKVLGGLALLHQAEARFDAIRQPRGFTTHYNSEWIRPWTDWVYRLFEGGFDAD